MKSNLVSSPSSLALISGIRLVGIGKKGSFSLPPELCLKIEQELTNPEIKKNQQIVIGGFLAGLLQKGKVKGFTESEQQIFKRLKIDSNDAVSIIDYLLHFDQGNKLANTIYQHLLYLADNLELTETKAEDLGYFLFAPNTHHEALKGFAVAVLRLRYETLPEWRGLMNSALKYTRPLSLSTTKKVIQFSEPFNGFKHCHHLTPLLAAELQKQTEYRVVHSIGRNSGPKYNGNLLDIQQAMQLPTLDIPTQEASAATLFGVFVKQSQINLAFDQWVARRQQLIKRPFLATLEKFLPAVKDIFLFVSSAFHPPYYEKMIDLAEHLGYKNIVIQKLGLEGGIGVALHRKSKYRVCQRQSNGTYRRKEWVFDPADYLSKKQIEAYRNSPKKIISIAEQKKQFTMYSQNKPIDPFLQQRVFFTTQLFKKILAELS